VVTLPRPRQYILTSEMACVEVKSPVKDESGGGIAGRGGSLERDSLLGGGAAGPYGGGADGDGAAKNAFVSQWTSLAR